MRLFWVIWMLISILLVALGVSLIVLSAVNFNLSPLVVVRIVVGCLWTCGGIALFISALCLLVSGRRKKQLKNKRRKFGR